MTPFSCPIARPVVSSRIARLSCSQQMGQARCASNLYPILGTIL
jgi:hypothetical protein